MPVSVMETGIFDVSRVVIFRYDTGNIDLGCVETEVNMHYMYLFRKSSYKI